MIIRSKMRCLLDKLGKDWRMESDRELIAFEQQNITGENIKISLCKNSGKNHMGYIVYSTVATILFNSQKFYVYVKDQDIAEELENADPELVIVII